MKAAPKTFATILAIGLASVLFCSQAGARPIVGSIDFGGVVTFDTMSLATATRVNIWNSSFVLQDTGDFSSISPTTHVTMATPWMFNPSTNTPSLWNVGGFTFNLSSASVTTQNANFLNITGIGTITSTNSNLDPTPGIWTFSSSNSNGSNSSTFGFQSTTDAVPEPGSMALFALSGFGLVALRRFRTMPRITKMKLPQIFAVRCGPL
jgi:hypothetical protein